eukprot:3055100-Rhodomonas_salina.1
MEYRHPCDRPHSLKSTARRERQEMIRAVKACSKAVCDAYQAFFPGLLSAVSCCSRNCRWKGKSRNDNGVCQKQRKDSSTSKGGPKKLAHSAAYGLCTGAKPRGGKKQRRLHWKTSKIHHSSARLQRGWRNCAPERTSCCRRSISGSPAAYNLQDPRTV